MNSHDVLIIGSDGLIGKALSKHLSCMGKSVITTTRRFPKHSPSIFLDLSENVTDWHPGVNISTAFICAGVTKFDDCERMPNETYRINVTSISQVVQTLSDLGVFIIYLSTSAVFDGKTPFRREEELAEPSTEYGRQKLETEYKIAQITGDHTIIRLTKVLGPNQPLFTNWIEMLRNGENIAPFHDISMAPVSLQFAVEAIAGFESRKLPGIWHVSGDRDISYDQIARHIGERINADKNLVKPVSIKESNNLGEIIPRFSSLNTHKFTNEFGIQAPTALKTIDSVIGI